MKFKVGDMAGFNRTPLYLVIKTYKSGKIDMCYLNKKQDHIFRKFDPRSSTSIQNLGNLSKLERAFYDWRSFEDT